MRNFILFCLAIASVHFCYAKDPIIHLSSKKNPIIVDSKKAIENQNRIVTLAIETRGKKFNFINYGTITPRLYSKDEHRFLIFSEGANASRPPYYKSDVLKLKAKSKRSLKFYLNFHKFKGSIYFTYVDTSGEYYAAKLKKGLYNLSFKYSINKYILKLYPKINKSLLWKKDLKSNSIELRIE